MVRVLSKVAVMPGRGTELHCFRIRDEIWHALSDAAQAAGKDRSTVLRELIAWYLGRGDLPKRPPQAS